MATRTELAERLKSIKQMIGSWIRDREQYNNPAWRPVVHALGRAVEILDAYDHAPEVQDNETLGRAKAFLDIAEEKAREIMGLPPL